MRSISALLVGPRLEPPEFAALYGASTVLLGSLGSGASRGRRPSVEILVAGELLPDQLRADHLAVLFDQAALGLMREERVGEPVIASG